MFVLFLCWSRVILEVSWDLWICIISKLQNSLNAKWFDSPPPPPTQPYFYSAVRPVALSMYLPCTLRFGNEQVSVPRAPDVRLQLFLPRQHPWRVILLRDFHALVTQQNGGYRSTLYRCSTFCPLIYA